ncbi:hypothetical protein G3A39_40425 [Paraburkholderia aspalathi]|nr:hypothetical protein [Paraburkholderia aspalathi]
MSTMKAALNHAPSTRKQDGLHGNNQLSTPYQLIYIGKPNNAEYIKAKLK